jgi:acyl-coenzyme A thioesterase PaaI-like protein
MTAIGDYHTFFQGIATGPWAEPDDPGRRVGDALRRLASQALADAPDDAALAALADQLEAISPPADEPAKGSRYRDDDRPPADGSRPVRPNGNGTHPLVGPRNPIAPPIQLRSENGTVYGDVVYDVRFEGLPGLVQGGFIAAAFDIMLGQGVALSGQGGVTGSLSVRYVAPTPLYTLLRYEARLDRRDGRKTFARAELRRCDDDTLCAESEGVFISPRPPGDSPATSPRG